MKRIAALAISSVTAGLLAPPALAAPAQAAANPAAALYVAKQCYACHGYAGQGGSAGPRLAATALALPAFARQLRTPMADMPPYSPRILGDDEVRQIYDYVRSLPGNGSKR